jgi:hypothetical protein
MIKIPKPTETKEECRKSNAWIFVAIYMVISLAGAVFMGIQLYDKDNEIKVDKSIIKSIYEKQDSEYKSDTLVDISNWDNIKYYDIISLNNGKSWYQISKTRNILGNFDILHPGLRNKINKQHTDLRKLTSYVDKHGPIGISGNVSEEEQQMLKNVGAITEAKFKDMKKDTMLVGTALPKEY